MGRKRLPPEEKKEVITVRLSAWLIEKLKGQTNYNSLIEKLLVNHFKENQEKRD